MSNLVNKKLKLRDCATIERGKRVTKRELSFDKRYPVYSGGVTPMGFFDDFNQNGNVITVVKYGTAGFVNFIEEKFWANDVCYCIKPNSIVDNKFLFYSLKNIQNEIYSRVNTDAVPAHLTLDDLAGIELCIPPLEVQKEIVDILDKFTALKAELEAELEARKKQYNYYQSFLLSNLNEQKEELIENSVDYIQPGNYIVNNTNYSESFQIPVLTAGKSFILGFTDETEGIYFASKDNPCIIFDDFTTSMHWVDFPFKVKSSALKILIPKNNVNNFKYIYYVMKNYNYSTGNGEHGRHWISKFSKLPIQLPSKKEQDKVVNILDKFSELVEDIEKGLPKEIKLRRKQYEYYRNKLLTFEEI